MALPREPDERSDASQRPRSGGLLARIPRWQTAGLCLGLIALLGVVDHFTAPERILTLLYLLPVFLGAWYVGRSFGLALAVVSAVASLAAEFPDVLVANLVGEAGIFATVALLVSRLKEHQASERGARQIAEGIMNMVPVRVFWKNKDLVYLGCNAPFARDAGFADPQDVIGKDDYQMGWRDQAELYRADDRQVIESGRSKLLIEEPQTTPEGKALVLLTSKVPRRGPRGEVVGVLGTYMDITERKRAQESSVRLATAVEQSAEAIVITDASGSILYTNPAFEKTTGYTSAEVLGQNPRILKSGKQDDEFYRQMWAVLSAGGVWSGHLVNKRKDGTLFEESATISPVHDRAGQTVNYVAVKRDVSNEIRLEQQLFQAQKIEAVGRLAGGVAHDFNNLLGVITGYGGIVHRRLAAEDPLKGKVEQILKAAERAAGLTRQLLAFSRKQVLQPEILDLNAVVPDMDKMLRRLIGEDVGDLCQVLGASVPAAPVSWRRQARHDQRRRG